MAPIPPPPAQQITFLYAVDLAASRAFYAETLRLVPVQEQPGVTIFAATPGGRGFVGICAARGPREARDPRHEGGVVLTLVSDAVEDWHGWLVARGVATDGPPERNDRLGITHIFFRDPAGYLLEIQRFDRPDWPMPQGVAA